MGAGHEKGLGRAGAAMGDEFTQLAGGTIAEPNARGKSNFTKTAYPA
jgi:hypothetical protein